MPIPVDVFPLAAGLSLWPERRCTGRSASGGSRRHRGGWGAAEPRSVRGCGEWARKPHWVEHMKGRFYSPAWHCFLNSDQGADGGQWSQYAYAHGNPFINVDPSGMSVLGDLLGGLLDPLHLAHSASVNWDHGRRGIEVGAAVIACIAVDYFSCGTASDTNPEIMAAAEGGTEVAAAGTGAGVAAGATAFSMPAYVGYDAAIGFGAGGLIGAKGSDWWSWRGACEGAVYGASLGFGFDCVSSGLASSANGGGFWAGVNNTALSAGKAAIQMPTTLSAVGQSAFTGGLLNVAMHGGSPWNNFRDGAIVGGMSAMADYSGLLGTGPLGRFAGEVGARSIYGMASGQPHTGGFYLESPAGNSIGQWLSGYIPQ